MFQNDNASLKIVEELIKILPDEARTTEAKIEMEVEDGEAEDVEAEEETMSIDGVKKSADSSPKVFAGKKEFS